MPGRTGSKEQLADLYKFAPADFPALETFADFFSSQLKNIFKGIKMQIKH